MGNTVQLTKNGQPVFPVTDVSLVMGLQDAIKLPPVKVTTLPTASAETAGKMYYVGPDANDEYERYITSATNGSYEWIDLGDTSIPLPSIADNLTTDDANTALSAKQGKVLNEELGELEAEVNEKADQAELSQLQQEATDLRTDVGERSSTTVRHTIATAANFTNSAKAVIADSGATNFGNTTGTGASSYSCTAYVSISDYAGKTLKYTRPVITGSSTTFGTVFFSGSNVASAIQGQVFGTSAAEDGYELVEVSIPSNAVNARFTFRTAELTNFNAYVDEVIEGDYTSGLGKDVLDLQAAMGSIEEDIEGIDDRLDDAEGGISSLGEQMEEVYEGGEVRTFVKSVVSQRGYGTLSVPIALSTVGDYVEFKVKLTDGRGGSYNYFLMLNPSSGNQPNINIYSRSQFSIRLPGKSGNNYTDSTLFANGNEVKAKVILDSIENGVYTYRVFINDIEREYTDLTSSSPFTLDSIGDQALSEQTTATNGADWYYLKYKTGGVEYTVDEFATKLTSPSGITDIYTTDTFYGLKELNEKIEELEGNSTPAGVLRYTADTEQFEFISRYGTSNKYFSFIVKHTVNNNVLRNLWRVMGGNLYTYDGNFSLEHSTIYGSSENEWAALFNEFRGSNNFTGGYHGGEMITDTGCFVKFFADGTEITDLSADFEIPCRRFEYIQYSALHEVYGTDGETPVPGQPIFAYHTKHTSFQDAKMECRNDVAFLLACTRRSYHAGLFSPERNAGTSAIIPFGIVAALSGTGNFTMASYGMNVSEIKFWNPTNKCGVNIQSEFIAGINEDEMSILGTSAGKAEFGVLDNGSGRPDAKYYKRTNKSVSIASGEVISTRHSVKFMAEYSHN